MLATLTERRFSDENWLYERKLDGVRTLAVRDGGAPQLWSRNEKRVDASYPEVVDALTALGGKRFVADGEIVAFDGAQTSFARLQGRIHLTGPQRIEATGVEVFYYLFDLLALDGADLTRIPLRDRKRVLRAAFDYSPIPCTSRPPTGCGRSSSCRSGSPNGPPTAGCATRATPVRARTNQRPRWSGRRDSHDRTHDPRCRTVQCGHTALPRRRDHQG
jgi:ATP-dependent DNA ligase